MGHHEHSDHGSHSHKDHGHGHHHHPHLHEGASRSLLIALLINAFFFVVEFVGGVMTHSLALLSDAAHMFTDVAALGLSLFALWISQKKADSSKTFGYQRAEVLAAFLNGLTLVLTVIWIFKEALFRLHAPAEVHSVPMLIVAVVGLLANLCSALMLHSHAHQDLNIRASYLHLLFDTLGSLAAVVAAIIIYVTGLSVADPIASFVIGVLTLVSSIGLIREAIDILMEATPRNINLSEVRRAMESELPRTTIHDLHVWSLGSRRYALSAHAILGPGIESRKALETFREILRAKFSIDHVTVQIEDSEGQEDCSHCEADPNCDGN